MFQQLSQPLERKQKPTVKSECFATCTLHVSTVGTHFHRTLSATFAVPLSKRTHQKNGRLMISHAKNILSDMNTHILFRAHVMSIVVARQLRAPTSSKGVHKTGCLRDGIVVLKGKVVSMLCDGLRVMI